MESLRVASRYAKALLGLASERGELKAVESDITTLSSLVDSSKEFELLLVSPVVKPDRRRLFLLRYLRTSLAK